MVSCDIVQLGEGEGGVGRVRVVWGVVHIPTEPF